ncbi:RNA polymerase sigma factor [Flavobacterium nitrogenifigens]|uniref:RNA polymerase sigma-70 factor, ECF subfamily n=1 Tax=Flavobacterium nitrogenifigens TaxID=1617283 RepID=A0A521BQS0_9FLAO|nr:sigma-70 family RNA polymerase sigma factor [Flavobacterium nitrogenifigens]KAF2330728.1 sigma-70 family RNA polymerase sigma factor [Flavobacterium nitrogenifigens]SMO49512.1 RNA polymerase sigma-70 factor, ECF subfamily [Flavobacterium nitrogenifigens]
MIDLNIPDSLLIKKYQEGNEEALSTLIKRHESRIYSFIYSKVKDKDISNDIFQDTFIKIIKTFKGNSYKEEEKFLSWVLRISHNLVIDHFRKVNRMPMQRETEDFSIFSIMQSDSQNIEDQTITSQIQTDIKKLIEELADDQKEIVIMRIYQNMSFKEISEEKEISINTALGRMRYAMNNLRKIIEKNKMILDY